MLKWMVGAFLAMLPGGFLLPSMAYGQGQNQAEIHQQKILAGFWNLRLSQRQEKDPYNQKNISEFKLGLSLKYSPLEYSYFHFAPIFKYKNGFQQTQVESEAQQSQLGMREASFNLGNYKPASKDLMFLASAGALDQTAHRPNLLFYDQTFAGVKLNSEYQKFFVEVEYAIPTSSSLSTQTKDFEKTPEFSSVAIGFETKSIYFSGTYNLGSFEFSNIPSATATKSALRGNSTRPTAGRDSEFIYAYSGYYLNSESELRIFKGNYLGLDFDYLVNSKVESSLGQGSDATAYWKLIWNKNFTYKPFYQYFKIDSDATIAAYNHPIYSTNRQGFRAGLEMIFKSKLSFSASYGEKDALIENPHVQRDNFIFLNLETTDVEI